eukprot:COSAG01_NODE_1152_length_11492_cov_12.314842_13_plen_84_part_00
MIYGSEEAAGGGGGSAEEEWFTAAEEEEPRFSSHGAVQRLGNGVDVQYDLLGYRGTEGWSGGRSKLKAVDWVRRPLRPFRRPT